jgi:hypothetical protein
MSAIPIHIANCDSRGGKRNSSKKKMRRKLSLEVNKNQIKSQKIKHLGRIVKRCKQKINSMKSLVKVLEQKKNLNAENCVVLESLSEVHQKLIKRKLGKKVKYSHKLRQFAVTLHFLSPKAYEFVRTKFDTFLLSTRTIGKWFQNINAEPGFTKEALKTKMQHSEIPLLCALLIDEMAIRKHLEWDGKNIMNMSVLVKG